MSLNSFSFTDIKMLKLTIVFVLMAAALVLGAPKSPFNEPGGRIIGGRDADIADYPYQLSFQYDDFHFCGAVLIAPSWALTAGHCIAATVGLPLTVRAGSSNSSSGGQVISVKRTILHPQYNPVIIDFDVGVLELEEPVTTENASPIGLPGSTNPVVPEAIASITGWGIDDLAGSTPETLKVVEVPVISQNDCVNAYTDRYTVTDNMFCAGFLGEGGKDSCNGDSGGPVAINNVLAGLVSWGGSGEQYPSCAEPSFPGVYTNVFLFVDWIIQNISYPKLV